MESIYHILVVDDDNRIRDLLAAYLQDHGFYVSTAKHAEQAREKLQQFRFDLLIIDVMMPGENGLQLTEYVKSNLEAPVLLLTAASDVEDRIKGLESGADDYLPKPFEPRELLLRAQNIIQRHAKEAVTISFGDFCFYPEKNTLTKGDESIEVTTNEAKLLTILGEHKGEAVSRDHLSQQCGGINTRSIDVQITRLRNKIERDPKFPVHLKTMRGKGYVLLAY